MDCIATADDFAFRDSIESCEFALAGFGHREHVRLAYVYLVENGPEASAGLMKRAILRLLECNGIDPSKYHETLTMAWILAVAHFMENSGKLHSADEFMESNPVLLDSDVMLTHYSADVLFSPGAREAFIEPDLSVIPRHDRPAS